MGRAVQGFLPFVPPTVTHNALEAYTFRRGGKTKAAVRKSDRLKRAEDMMRPYVERLAKSSACCPIRGKVTETLKICWPTEGVHEQGELRDDPPDLDNWIKTFNDLCEACGVISNDAHVVRYKDVCKVWADPAGVFVRFEEIPRARGQDGRAS